MFQDSYRQEVGAEEDVHRTLPFFATALGLIVTAINYAASQLPPWALVAQACRTASGAERVSSAVGCGWPLVLTALLLAVSALLSVGVLVLLALATKRRAYERVGPEDKHVERARGLRDYHEGRGLESSALDLSVSLDLRDQLLDDFAQVIPVNRTLNLQRYKLRARAVSWLLWSLLSALLATILSVVMTKLGFSANIAP